MDRNIFSRALFVLPLVIAMTASAAAEEALPALSAKGRAALFAEPGQVNVGDVNWLMWRFSRDTTAHADWKSLTAWVAARKVAQTQLMKKRIEALAEPGLDASGLAEGCYDDLFCVQVATLAEAGEKYGLLAKLKSAIAEAAPTYRAYDNAIEAAMGEPPVYVGAASAMRDKLAARIFHDQMWIKVAMKPHSMPNRILFAQTNSRFVQSSFDNQKFVATEVMTAGWPPISTFGKREAANVWLMVQHSDHVPDFQLKALQAMRQLLAGREVSRSNYAYLYDRVRVNLGQKQRYGSQFECRGGKMVPKPLEAPEQIDALRKEMDMEPLADYAKMFSATCIG